LNAVAILVSHAQILLAVVYAALVYRKDPATVDSLSYDIYNREKANEDLKEWKKQQESWDTEEAFERVRMYSAISVYVFTSKPSFTQKMYPLLTGVFSKSYFSRKSV